MKARAPFSQSFACGDFPTWLPAVLVKELRQGLHTGGFVAMLLLFHAVMVVAMTTTVASLQGATPAARAASAATSNSFFWTLLAVMLLVVLPARALVGLRAEVDSRTLDLLVLTQLTSWRIVLGKWASLVTQGFLLLVAMLPYGLVRYFAGSVDLYEDGTRCLILLGGCGLLTAAALLCSALPRVAAIPVAILIAYGEGTSAFRGAAIGGAYSGELSFAVSTPSLAVFDGALLLLLFLILAVRRIAPPAENYDLLTRLLAFPAFLATPLLASQGKAEVARFQFIFALVVLVTVCVIELSSGRIPMAVHKRGFGKAGPLGRMISPIFLPGWPSALFFTLLASAFCVALFWWGGIYEAGERATFARLSTLMLGGLIFPAVARAAAGRAGLKSGMVYGITIAGLCLIAGVTSVFSDAPLMPRWWLDLASVLPISSFWMEFTRGTPPAHSMETLQYIVSAATMLGALVLMAPYWRAVAALDLKEPIPTTDPEPAQSI